jgi:hypothetical protein
MYPEGCTTNNTSIIQFRKGAFFGLCSVQPLVIKYWSPFFRNPHDILNPLAHMILCCSQPFGVATAYELPVFKPNDYFFEHHQKTGEDKW